MKKLEILITVLILGYSVIIIGCFNNVEIDYDYFQNFQDISIQGKQSLLEQGLIPKVVPDSSTEINVEYVFNANRRWMRFKAPKSAMQPLLIDSVVIAGSEKEDLRYHNPLAEVDWWFKDINDVTVYRVKNDQSRYPTYVAESDEYYYLWVEGES